MANFAGFEDIIEGCASGAIDDRSDAGIKDNSLSIDKVVRQVELPSRLDRLTQVCLDQESSIDRFLHCLMVDLLLTRIVLQSPFNLVQPFQGKRLVVGDWRGSVRNRQRDAVAALSFEDGLVEMVKGKGL